MNWIKYALTAFVGLLSFVSSAQAQALSITTPMNLPPAYPGDALTPIQLQATGGTAPYTWALLTGSPSLVGKLAPGLSVTSSGQIVGTPTALQASTGFKVRVTDSASKFVDKVLAIAVLNSPPVLSLAPMNPAFAGSSYSWTFNATQGRTPYSWSTTSTLPASLSLDSTTGILSGTILPTQLAGNFTLAITVTGSNGVKASGNYVLAVYSPFSWLSNSTLPSAKVAHTYNASVSAMGGIPPYTFALKTGSSLPAGLSLNATTGLISGTPTTSGNYSFTLVSQDSTSPANSIERTFSLSIEPYGMSVDGPSAISGTQYLATTPAPFSVSGGVATYQWSSVPALPTGLSIDPATGVISGKLMGNPGNFTVAVTVKDGKNQTATRNCTISVTPSGPLKWDTSESLLSGQVASAYSQNLTASGGRPAYKFAVKTGSTLPAGLTLNATSGRLSGTPTTAGNFSFTITAADTASPVGVIERTFTVEIQAYGMSISGPSTISIKRYQALTPATFSVVGGTAPFSWKTTPALPAGLTLNATTGVLSGTPTATAGTYPVVISVTDSKKQTATQNCTITIEPTDLFDWVTPASLPSGQVASAYSQNLTASGGRPAYKFAVKTGSTLPAGLTLNATSGRLSGTPTTAGNFSFTITAADTASPVGLIERVFTVEILAYGMSVSGPTTISGQRYKAITPATYSVSGGEAPYLWSTVPALPTGLSMNATTGTLSGNITAVAGNYTVAVTVKDKGNQTATQNCTIAIAPADPFDWVTPASLPSGQVASAYSQNLTVSGGRPGYTYVLKNGSVLPAGLKLDGKTGVISGIPTLSSFLGNASASGFVFTLAGSGAKGFADGNGTAAVFYGPHGVAVDAGGNVYVADSSNNRIRKITPDGIVTTLAGSGNEGHADGNGASALFYRPNGVAVDAGGNVYVADSLNNRIRKITPTGTVTTLAGSGIEGYADGSGTAASFNYPSGVAVDAGGNVYVADFLNNRIRKITPSGTVSTLAGSGIEGYAEGQGAAGSFHRPTGLAVDGGNNVYVADYLNNRIRKITPSGNVSTLAGSGIEGYIDGNATTARFCRHVDVDVDESGNVYVADGGNRRIRKITPSGIVTTLVFSDGTSPSFDGLTGVAIDGSGNLYVPDYVNHRIRKITQTATGSDKFTIIARDSASPQNSIEREFTLSIAPYGMTISGPSTIAIKRYQALTPATYTVVGGTAPFSWKTTPTLPAGLTLNATTGVLSGTPTATAGTYPVVISVTDSKKQTATHNCTITIEPTDLFDWGTPASLPSGQVASAYSQNLTASGGRPAYKFAVKTGSTLPAGLTLNATSGRLSGTPTTAGNFSFTITAADTASPVGLIERTFTVEIQAYGMSISGPSTISIKRYQVLAPATFSVVGGTAPFSWKTTPTLPAGLTLNATTGVLSGMPTATAGTYPVVISVTDSKKQTATQNCTITIEPTDLFDWGTPASLPSGQVASAYSQNLTASGGRPAYKFAVKTGSTLPAGLTLNATSGRLSGTPTTAGNFSFTITAADTASPVGLIERTFTLSIAPYGMTITDNSPFEITGTQFQPLPPNTFSATGGQPTYKWSSTPTLPAGLTLNATTGILSGVPTTAGNTTIAVRVTDGANQTVTKNCTIRILPAGNLTITTANPLPSATVNASYSTTLAASGGKPFLTTNQSTYYKWAIAAQGNLPASLTLNATTGILSGTANAALTANFSVKVTDAANAFVTSNYTLQIAAPDGVSDLDKDGVNDYRELYDGTNPNDPTSFNPLSVGLVAHYPFDGDIKDQSGFSYQAQNFGAVSSSKGLKETKGSFYFSGNGSYLTVDQIPIPENNAFSWSLWIKPESVNSEMVLMNRVYQVGNNLLSPALFLNKDSSHGTVASQKITFYSYANGGYDITTSPQSFSLNNWIQITVTSQSNGSRVIYLNGIQSAQGVVNNYGQKLQKLVLGANGQVPTSFYKGFLANVRIYNRALSAAEVSQLYSEESGEGANMVLVQGGTLPAGSGLANQTVSAFHIARFETTWAEWKKVRTWAAANGYDIGIAGQGSADNHPVRNVSWYDAVKWCNAKSQMDGLMPVYSGNGTTYKTGIVTPTPVATANGYRLPAEAEWEWAARGGVKSNGYIYSGSNDLNLVAWNASNSSGAIIGFVNGQGTWPVGMKLANELEIFDMSGNLWEWCGGYIVDSSRLLRGGSWGADSVTSTVSFRGIRDQAVRDADSGFRYARNAIGDMVIVQGGTLPAGSALANQTVQAFQIGRTEVTWDEWQTVRTWAVANGYTDLAGVGQGSAGNHPIRNVSWYDVVKWSNAKSQMEGLTPVYSVNGTIFKSGQSTPIPNATANGYRLPAEAEWEWAAFGGEKSKGFLYAGSNNVAEVAWYLENAQGSINDYYGGRGSWPVSLKLSNELGIYDMCGNVAEWCWDFNFPNYRAFRGSSNYTILEACPTFWRQPSPSHAPDVRNVHIGLRLARNIGPKISISGTLPEATLNQAYAGYTFGAVGSTGDKVWSISEGTLPPGMSFSANGTLSGTPTTAGSYTFVIRVDAGGYWDEIEVELQVLEANPDYTSGLVAYYPFNGNSNDASGNNRHGTVSGAELSADRFGLTNRAYYFDGVNFDKISINIPSLSEMTLSLWVTPSGAQSGGGIGRFLHSEPEWFDVGLSNPAGSYIGTKIGSQDSWRQSSVKLEPNIAQMVTFTAGNGILKIYLNGKLVENVSYNGTLGMSPKILGSYVANQGDDFYGILDDVRIYNRVLTKEQISSLHVYEKNDMVAVKGGVLPSVSGFSGQAVALFQIGKYEVTWDEWQTVRTWAVANGYTDLANIGAGSAGNHPVRHINWYDAVKWCNAKSQKEGLTPVYQLSGAIYKTGQSEPTVNTAANGYRLPLEKEWEWAALGGANSKGFSYSGSNDINAVAWYASNSGSDTKPAGLKTANELMIFDMSGNVAEWCWGTVKPRTSPRGGGCLDTPIGNSIPGSLNPEVRALQFGFRLARNLDAESSYDIDGLRYIYVKDRVRSWSEAKLDAESRGGQLATFSTSTKWSKLAEKLTQDYDKNAVSAWIGGIRSGSGWKWIDDTSFSFTNWSPGEPNNSNDKVIMIWGKDHTHNPNDSWSSKRVPNAWNDAPDSTAYKAAAYILEIK